MSRKGKSLLFVSLTALAAFAGCSHGGPLDPLDNVGGSTMMPPPPGVTTDLSDCSETTKAPCKISLTDLSFTLGTCGHQGDTTLGKPWNNPNGDTKRVQFGVSESSTLKDCPSFERQSCEMTFSAVPALFKTMSAGKIKLTLSEKHKLSQYSMGSGATISALSIATATLRFGTQDVFTLTGSRTTSGGSLELAPVTAWLTPGADRSLGLRINTECGQVFSNNLQIYLSVEGIMAEMLP
jgi:hypothetical protein